MRSHDRRPSPLSTLGPPRLDGYEVVRRLGSGGMGVVYEAFDVRMGRRVAIKMLQDAVRERASARERLLREARGIARISHPNVVGILEVVTTEDRVHLVLEYVDGRPLDEAMRREADLRRRLEIFEQVAQGVAAAHRCGVVHRDLKPSNVLVGPDGRPRVLDFGIARLEGLEGITRTDAGIGTPRYMAPEQVRGGGDAIGPWTDVFALGAMLYELVAGRLPHVADSEVELFAKICKEEPAPPRRLRPDLPRDLESIVLTALEKEPGRRYADAGALAAELRRHLDGEPVEARSSTTIRRTLRRVRPGRRVAMMLAAAVVASAMVGIAVLAPWRRVDRQRPPPPARAPESAASLLLEARDALERADRLLYSASPEASAQAALALEARRRIDEALARAPGHAEALFLAGWADALEGDLEAAAARYRTALPLPGAPSQTGFRLAGVLIEASEISTGDRRPFLEEAGRLLEAHLASLEGDALASALERRLARVRAAACRGDVAALRRAGEEAVAELGARRGMEEVHCLIGYASSGRPAREAFLRALEIRPRSPRALAGLGRALFEAGEREEGRRRLLEALDGAPPRWIHAPAVLALLERP